MGNNSVSIQLKEATKVNHQSLEKLLVGKLKSIESKQDYVQILQFFYSFFGALEDRINLHFPENPHDPQFVRRKAISLVNDIEHLGSTLQEKAKADDLPGIQNKLQALGALYVIEGSTLGGPVIASIVKRRLNDDGNKSYSFFHGYGEETHDRWATFRQLLDSEPQSNQEKEIIIQTANETFSKFKDWIQKYSA